VLLVPWAVRHPQLIIGDSPLTLSFKTLLVNGTFRMGTPACPLTSRITVLVPGGAEEYGMDVGGATASFDVHGAMQVSQVVAVAGGGATCAPVVLPVINAASPTAVHACQGDLAVLCATAAQASRLHIAA
jgi:hypothetical protein